MQAENTLCEEYFDFFEKLALNKGYTSIRVYTDNEFDKAILLYEKKEMIKEFYKNDLENEEINNGTIIYSKSLTFLSFIIAMILSFDSDILTVIFITLLKL